MRDGATLMPGMVEGHAHPTFRDTRTNTDLGDIPVEEHLLATPRNAELLLDHGFTSLYSGLGQVAAGRGGAQRDCGRAR